MKYLAITLSIMISGCFTAIAQKKLPEITLDQPELIGDYVLKNFSFKGADSLCLRTIIFSRFTVSPEGTITVLGFTKGAQPAICAAAKKAMETSNGHWNIKDVDKERLKSLVFVFPLVVDLTAACNPGGSELRDPRLPRDRTPVLREIFAYKSNDAVANILTFDDKSFDNLACILLSPVRIGMTSE